MKQGFLNTILNGDAVGTKVNVRHRQGGYKSGVVVKRGSTVVSNRMQHLTYVLFMSLFHYCIQEKTVPAVLTHQHTVF